LTWRKPTAVAHIKLPGERHCARFVQEACMDAHTQTHLLSLREALKYEECELRAKVHAAEMSAGERGVVPPHDIGDIESQVKQPLESEQAGTEEQRDMDDLAMVEAALKRLDDGVYGDCRDCGRPVIFERLWAQPAAERCADCQSVFEARLRT
jgi:RNA polymerase-binding transcription factor DksA